MKLILYGACMYVTDNIFRALDISDASGLVPFIFSKAFNTLDHYLLYYAKLSYCGFFDVAVEFF